jgi:hypothetical protein
MSDANRTAVGLCEEATLGVTPANPVFESLRVTGANLSYAKQTATSKELRSDRQITDLITTGFQAGGDIPMEASYGALDSQIRGAFMSDWALASVRQNTATQTANISAVSATAYTLIASDGTQYRTGAFAQYMLVVAAGFVAAGNNRTVVAGAASSGTSIVMTAGVVDAAPAVGARVKQIGFQGPSGDMVAVAGGLGTQGLTSTTLDFTTMGLTVGTWVYVGGPSAGTAFATAGTRGFCRIASIAAHSLLFDVVPSTWAADAGVAKTVQVYVGDYIRNGVTRRSYTIELQYQDLAVPEYEYYTGMVPSDLALTVQAQSILTAKITYMGLTAADVTARATGATDTAAPTGDVLTGSNNVGFLYENGAPIAGPNFVLGANIALANNLRRNTGLGSLASVNIGVGQALVTGDLNMYYGNNAILQKIRNSVASGYAVGLIDNTTTRAVLIDIPRIKFSDGNPTVPGIDTDRMLDAKFSGVRHPTLGYTIQCQRFEAFNV